MLSALIVTENESSASHLTPGNDLAAPVSYASQPNRSSPANELPSTAFHSGLLFNSTENTKSAAVTSTPSENFKPLFKTKVYDLLPASSSAVSTDLTTVLFNTNSPSGDVSYVPYPQIMSVIIRSYAELLNPLTKSPVNGGVPITSSPPGPLSPQAVTVPRTSNDTNKSMSFFIYYFSS